MNTTKIIIHGIGTMGTILDISDNFLITLSGSFTPVLEGTLYIITGTFDAFAI